jgi:hypothetical protein
MFRFSWIVLLATLPLPVEAGKPNVERLVRQCSEGKAKACSQLADLARHAFEPDVRMAAVEHLTDQAVLAEIARQSPLPDYRVAAIERLEDPSVLAEIATSAGAEGGYLGKPAFEAALARITDQKVIERLATGSGSELARQAALAKLTDQEALARIGRGLKDDPLSDRSAQLIAENLTDQGALAELATSAVSASMRKAARRELKDQPALAASLEKDPEYDFLETPTEIRRLSDSALLGRLAAQAKNARTREGAVGRVRDAALLARIAKEDGEVAVRHAAATRLSAVQHNVTATGALFEPSLGEPLAGLEVDLGVGSNSIGEAVTDDQGAFVLDALAAGQWSLEHDGYALHGPKGAFLPDVHVPSTGRVELGRMDVCVDERVTAAFAGACAAGGLNGRLPAAKLLAFMKGSQGGWSHSYETLAKIDWDPPWKAALCIDESVSKVGDYVTATGERLLGGAKATIWSVRLVRLEDGKSFETRVYAAPPEQTTGSHGLAEAYGNPVPKLQEWLKTIQ